MSGLNSSMPCTVVAMAPTVRESGGARPPGQRTDEREVRVACSRRLSTASAWRARYDRVVAIEHGIAI